MLIWWGVNVKAFPQDRWAPLFFAAAALVIYGNALNGAFLWDDHTLVHGNFFLQWKNLIRLLTSDIAAGTGGHYDYYRPLQMITYLLDRSLWGENTFGYHLSNVLLHAGAAWVCYSLALLLLRDRAGAFIAALLFLVHPVHTEAVSYISGRADSLAAIFIGISVIFYLKDEESKNRAALVFGAFALGLFSKESAVLTPILAMLCGALIRRKPDLKILGLMLLISLAYAGIRLVKMAPSPAEFTLMERIAAFLASGARLSQSFFFPAGIHLDYGYPRFQWNDPQVWIGALVWAGILAAAVKFKNRPAVLFGILWFLIALFPATPLAPAQLHSYFADHWLYLPSWGIFLIAGKAAAEAVQRGGNRRKIAGTAVALVAVISAGLTIHQNTHWRDSQSLSRYIVRQDPNSWKACYSLGIAAEDRGDANAAMQWYTRALKIRPAYAEAHYNLGGIQAARGDNEGAIQSYKEAIRAKPNFFEAYNNLGNVLKSNGRIEEAKQAYRDGLKIRPHPLLAQNLAELDATN